MLQLLKDEMADNNPLNLVTLYKGSFYGYIRKRKKEKRIRAFAYTYRH